MTDTTDPVRVFVGTDRSQLLAVKVLEHSIKRHTSLQVEVQAMLDLPLPEPRDPRQGKRTGFSFARFAIPRLAGYHGRALYLDADMLVFKDIRSLWNLPFGAAKVIIQSDIPKEVEVKERKIGAPTKRIKQTAVMLLDCGALDWRPEKIIDGLNGQYTYEALLHQLCILKPEEISYAIPFAWNSLEHWTDETCLLHYTDMNTQPWVSPMNVLGYLWMREVKMMLDSGTLSRDELKAEIDLGFFRPSLLAELDDPAALDGFCTQRAARMQALDETAGFVKHKQVYEAKHRREEAIRAYEEAASKEPRSILKHLQDIFRPASGKVRAAAQRIRG